MAVKMTNPAYVTSSVVVIDPVALTIQVQQGGSGNNQVDANGITLQCIYSYLKQQWRSSSTLIKYPFPMLPITATQFELINGWNWKDTTSKTLVRDGGWALKDTSNVVQEKWANITTLGNFNAPATDTAYYQQASGAASTAAVFPGPVNQAVQYYGDATHGNMNYAAYFKIFLRIQGKTYDFYDLITAQNLSSLDYTKFAMPLSNAIDLKISTSDSTIAANTPYTGITVTYITASIKGAWVTGTAYALNDVVSSGGRWYKCTTAHTASAAFSTDQASKWTSYTGERQIGTSYYAFTTIINGNSATAEQIYEKIQYMLRQNTTIDTGSSVKGNTASTLLYFVGDTLTTQPGVYIDSFRPADTNRINFYDYANTLRQYPYVAAGQILFNNNLTSDYTISASPAVYTMFFTTNPGGNYGTANAVIVQDKDATNISGNINGTVATNGYVSFSFNYDSNVQGGRTAGTDAGVTVVAIGTTTAQYVSQTSTITRSTSNVIQLVSSLERNYNGV